MKDDNDYQKMVGKTVAAVDEHTYGCDLRIDFTDGTHICLLVAGGDGGVCGEWISDQEIVDRARYEKILIRLNETHQRAKIHPVRSEVVRDWNGWEHIIGDWSMSEEDKIFMDGRP